MKRFFQALLFWLAVIAAVWLWTAQDKLFGG